MPLGIFLIGHFLMYLTYQCCFLKGVSTAKEVYEVLSHRGWQELFPLFTTVHEISAGRLPPTAIVEYSEHKPKFSLVEGSDKYYWHLPIQHRLSCLRWSSKKKHIQLGSLPHIEHICIEAQDCHSYNNFVGFFFFFSFFLILTLNMVIYMSWNGGHN